MFNPKIFVPYSLQRGPLGNEPFKLYTVLCAEAPQAIGYEIYDPDKPYIHKKEPERIECRKKLKALRENIFKEEKENNVKREFHLRQKGKDIPGAVIHDNTQSVFLGLYLTLYQKIEKVRFNAEWTSITVTGNIEIEDKDIKLSKAGDVEDKFKDYKKDIENYRVNNRDRHLFVYVSEKPLDEVKSEGNITVRHFSPHDTMESVRNCVFERQYEDELQEFLCKNIRDQTRNIDYIPTKAYLNIEADIGGKILNLKTKGCFIWGAGESGKSETAEALARHLMRVDSKFYAPIWIKIGDDLKGNKRDDITLEGPAIEYITEKIRKKVKEKEEISDLTEFLEKHQYLLVIDNLEFDNKDLNEVLQGIKDIIEDMQLNWPYLIITSRTSCIASMANEMSLEIIKSPELCKEDIEKFFDTITGSDISLGKIKQKDEYTEFIDALYEHFRSYPGLIIPEIESIKSGKTIGSLLPELKSIRTEGFDEKALIMFRPVFSMLDESSQTVLFTLLDNISPDTTIGQDKLIEAVKEKAAVPGLLIPGMAEKALNNLVNKALIYREASVEDKLPRYGIKEVPFLAFMFGDIFAGQDDAKKKKNLRESLVRNTWHLHMALRYERSAEIIDELEKDIDDPLELGDIYYQEVMFGNPDTYITKSVEYYGGYIIKSVQYYKEAARSVLPSRERYHKAVLQYLKAFDRALRIKGTMEWDVFYVVDGNMATYDDTLMDDPEYCRGIGYVFHTLGYHFYRDEEYFDIANQAYKGALTLYSPKTDIKAIRVTKIDQAFNLNAWSDVTKNKKAILDQSKNILMDNKYFGKHDVNPAIDALEYAYKEMALADTYLKLSFLFEDNEEYKKNAIASYINARDIYARKKYWIQGGIAWYNLSIAYKMCNPAVEDLNLSIDACKEALKIFHKNDFPLYYAEIMVILGTTYTEFLREGDEKIFEKNLDVYREAEEIFREREMSLGVGRVKHNIGVLYYQYASNPSNSDRKADLLGKSIDIFKEADKSYKEAPNLYNDDLLIQGSALLIQGRACLDLAEILPDDNEEKVSRIKEAIEASETGIEICIKHSIEPHDKYKWLHHNNALAHEHLYKFTRAPEDIDKALSNVTKAMEYANFKEKERMEADYSRMMNAKANMGP